MLITCITIDTSSQPPNLHVGGVKMRERTKGSQPLRMVNQNRTNDYNKYDDEDRSSKAIGRRKTTRKIIRAGSLVRSNNPNNKGRNQAPPQNDDFTNSFIEGKSFNTTNSKKAPVMEKPSFKDQNQVRANESDVSEPARNVRDLEANSKILDYQNKIIASASIGPYPIGSNIDPTVTMRSIGQASDNIDKKLKQRQYVKELEEQIKMRDLIKREEEQKLKSKKYNMYPELEIDQPETSFEPQTIYQPSSPRDEVSLSPAKPTPPSDDRRELGSAPKAVESAIVDTVTEGDPFGGNIPIRRKVVNRIDQELESRGSIFSGRDEKSILIRKRNIQQQHMREELLRQIEEKKRREDEIKKRKMEEDLEEENRIQEEIKRLDSQDQPTENNERTQSIAYQNKPQPLSGLSNGGYLPELNVKQHSAPIQENSSILNSDSRGKHLIFFGFLSNLEFGILSLIPTELF